MTSPEYPSPLRRLADFYLRLNLMQRMHFNAIVVFIVFVAARVVSGINEVTLSLLRVAVVLWTLAVARDLLQLYKQMYATLAGKGVILVLFSLCTTLAISIAGQVVNDVTGVEPSKFPNATAILSIFTIPFIFSLIMGVLFFVIMLAVPLIGFYYLGVDDSLKKVILPVNAKAPTMVWPKVTRVTQFISVGFYCAFIYGMSHHIINGYASFMTRFGADFIYTFETYAKSPCVIPAGTRAVLLDDDHILQAKAVGKEKIFALGRCHYRTDTEKKS